jgi:hypothetical protein
MAETSLLTSETTAPSDGAAPDNVTVPVSEVPPGTELADTDRASRTVVVVVGVEGDPLHAQTANAAMIARGRTVRGPDRRCGRKTAEGSRPVNRALQHNDQNNRVIAAGRPPLEEYMRTHAR